MELIKNKYQLQKSPKIKGDCPECKGKKCFTYYENLPLQFGICDHINSCQHHEVPTKQKLAAIGYNESTMPDEKQKEIIKIVYPAIPFCKATIENQTSNFHKFCIEIMKLTPGHLKKWNCGTIEDKTAFVYQNLNQQFANIVHIEYALNGKRNKGREPYSLKAIKGEKYSLCLFGEHLLTNKTVCLVESEKTAIIASFFYPQFDWIATGGANKLTDEKISILFGRKIYYLNDADKAGLENSTIKKLAAYKQDHMVIQLYPDRNDGYDLADAIIDGKRPEIKPNEKEVQPLAQLNQQVEPFYKFKWATNDDGEKYIKDVLINYTSWIELLYSFGFRRFDINKNFIFVKIDKKIIAEVTITQIQDFFIKYLKELALTSELDEKKRMLIVDKFYKNPSFYFCQNRLSLLVPNEKIIFNSDTKNESFTYFKNGFVKATKDGWNLCDYNELNGYIWKEQILQKDFKFIDYKNSLGDHPVFATFMFNISGKDEDRFRALCSITGYNLHSYYETKLKATILTDSTISEDAEGRTGKTLYAKALGQIKRYVEIAGKDFKHDEKYKYSACSLDTQIVHINDAKKYIDIDVFFNDITEGITVERKNQHAFNVLVKMIISTNKSIKIDGGSSRDRVIEFELSNHYSDKFSPQDEFKQWFFRDWDSEEWSKFYNFLIYCQWVYFEHGVIEPAQINLNKRKLLDHTCAEFVEFMGQENIIFNEKIDRKILHTSFLEAYTDCKTDKFKSQLKTFTKWLIQYAQYTEGFSEIKKDIGYGRANNINWIIFTRSN